MSNYKEEYLAEAREHLASMNQALLDLENEKENQELLNTVFRSAHTLKSSSSAMGYNHLSELTHKMEDVLGLFRDKERNITSQILDVLFKCLDAIEEMLDSIEEDGGDEKDIQPLLQELESLTGENKEEETKESEKNVPVETGGLNVKITLDENCKMKTVRAMLILKALSKLGNITNSNQPLETGNSFEVKLQTTKTPDEIQKAIQRMNEVKEVQILEKTSGNRETEEDTVKEEKTSEKTVEGEAKEDSVKTVAADTAKQIERKTVRKVQSIRVSMERLDELMNLVGELVIYKIRLNQLSAQLQRKDLLETASSIDRITNELRETVMQTRMVPVSQVFSRFPRMVRDISHSLGKEIDLVIEGGEIEVDRTVLDEIGEPLVHLLRNSIDHGIETPSEREKAGKKPRGIIHLTARRERGQIVIEVGDDGRGIDPNKIRETAIKKGILTPQEAENLNEKDLLALIFSPGFSTANKVTDTSGRGVGMDVVRTKIEALGGSVHLDSTPGEGTRVTLHLPLTMAIIQTLLIEVDSHTYAIPITNVLETLVTRETHLVNGRKVINLRGSILPLLSLRHLFNHTQPALETEEELTVVVVEDGVQKYGLVVDRLIGQQEVAIKSLDTTLKTVKGISGATILGDGQVMLILDIPTLLTRRQQ